MNLREAAQRALEALEFVDTQDWDELEALRESLREHMAEIHRLRAALAEATINEKETVEPVAWNEYPIDTDTTRGPMLMTVGDTLSRAGFIKKQKPLSIETINKLWNDAVGWGDASSNEVTFVRAIERAHGIGGEE